MKSKLQSTLPIAALILLLLVGLNACNIADEGKPRSTGSVNEILIVTNSKEQWNGPLGDTIRTFFGADLPGLPQSEPMFGLYNIASKDLNDVFKKFHNILIVDINPQAKKTLSETKKDLWARSQRVIKITAPDTLAFYQEFDLKKAAFLKYFEQNERERSLKIGEMSTDMDLSNKISQNFDLTLEMPAGFYIAEETANFMWLRQTIHNVKQDVEIGIMIYYEKYTDTIMFSPISIINRRNDITRVHIPGPSEGTYMKVAAEFVPPIFKRINDFPTGFAVETRGLWDVKGDFMGGPFISYTFVDQERARIFTLDGYVYNPNELKRNYIRQLESIFYSVKINKTK